LRSSIQTPALTTKINQEKTSCRQDEAELLVESPSSRHDDERQLKNIAKQNRR